MNGAVQLIVNIGIWDMSGDQRKHFILSLCNLTEVNEGQF